eukprot:TRINITY_DN38691_c0_g1_i1.p1 TRINITY_DN38691_c0_g1~~TRINITY_DN38691_c0_g1_i1.p1  ORF type:complete len:907 (-),score=212.24 TRINITY_DN38691_c0_g1_i1:261-2981(-)
MPPLRNLHSAALRRNADGTREKSTNFRTYRWMQFEGREHVTEFDDSHFEMEGSFESHSSEGHKEYQARIRAIFLRKQGKGKADIAKILGRSERYVSKWWQKEEQEVPKPWGVHGFLGGEMGFEAVQSGARIDQNTVTDAATWWRDVEIRRGFAKDPEIYSEIMARADWETLPSNTKDFSTGAAVMKYLKDGSVCTQSYLKAKYSPGLSPATDRALQKLFAEFGIEGRTVGVLLNRYDDGQAMLGSHRHDCWTALFSFGSERILTIDNTPLLCQDGDLVIFGTQRHGVPKMPEIDTGRITVVVFFYPNHLQKQRMWQTVADQENNVPSRALVAIQHDTYLGNSAQDWQLWGFGGKGYKALEQLKRLGLAEADESFAKEALLAFDFDQVKAASFLLRRHSPLCASLRERTSLALDSASAQSRGRWGRKCYREAEGKAIAEEHVLASEDLELALLALAEAKAAGEAEACLPTGERPVFRAEDWDGISGDLVAHFLRGGNVQLTELDKMLKLDEMKPAHLLSVGTANIPEKQFFEMLNSQGVSVVYDFRASESSRDVRSSGASMPQFTKKNLRIACKARGMFYKHMALGRESAYGILAHLRSPEGQHTLLEVVWQAQRQGTAFLGSEADWRHDARLAIAEALVKAGHTVDHIASDGSLQCHESSGHFPDWMLQEEERLRKLEKQRHEGELQRREKSGVDRSTESVALRLMKAPEAVDTMTELREAQNQQELKFAQRKLATTQRFAEKYELPSKVLSGAPSFIAKEAQLQAAWVEQRKKEKDNCSQTAKADSDPHAGFDIEVECRVCTVQVSWSMLREGDGICAECSAAGHCKAAPVSEVPETRADEDFLVECTKCGLPASWSLLAPGDGYCPSCVSNETATIDSGSGAGSSSASSNWRRRHRQDSEKGFA